MKRAYPDTKGCEATEWRCARRPGAAGSVHCLSRGGHCLLVHDPQWLKTFAECPARTHGSMHIHRVGQQRRVLARPATTPPARPPTTVTSGRLQRCSATSSIFRTLPDQPGLRAGALPDSHLLGISYGIG